jgi:hypothetical protein
LVVMVEWRALMKRAKRRRVSSGSKRSRRYEQIGGKVCLSACLPACFSVYLSDSPTVCTSVRPSVRSPTLPSSLPSLAHVVHVEVELRVIVLN